MDLMEALEEWTYFMPEPLGGLSRPVSMNPVLVGVCVLTMLMSAVESQTRPWRIVFASYLLGNTLFLIIYKVIHLILMRYSGLAGAYFLQDVTMMIILFEIMRWSLLPFRSKGVVLYDCEIFPSTDIDIHVPPTPQVSPPPRPPAPANGRRQLPAQGTCTDVAGNGAVVLDSTTQFNHRVGLSRSSNRDGQSAFIYSDEMFRDEIMRRWRQQDKLYEFGGYCEGGSSCSERIVRAIPEGIPTNIEDESKKSPFVMKAKGKIRKRGKRKFWS